MLVRNWPPHSSLKGPFSKRKGLPRRPLKSDLAESMPSFGQATALILAISFAASGGAGAFVASSAIPGAALPLIRMNAGSATARPGGGGAGGEGSRKQGRLKFFNPVKGFGFVSPSGGGDDVFLHQSEVQGSTTGLVEGAELTFELRKDGTGRTSAAAAELVGVPGSDTHKPETLNNRSMKGFILNLRP